MTTRRANRASSSVPPQTALLALVVGVLLVVLPAAPAGAQDQPTPGRTMQATEMHQPPAVLVIYREVVKPGRTASHDTLEANFARTYAGVPNSAHYMAMTSVTGTPEAWFVEPEPDFASVQKAMAAEEHAPATVRAALDQIMARETDNLSSSSVITALYREDLSFKPGVDMAKMRFMQVTTYHVRPGHSEDFARAAKLVRATYEKANLSEQWAVYQVYSGAPAGTFYVFEPSDSFATLGPNAAMEKTFDAALGDEGRRELMQLVSDGIVSSEMNIFAFKPAMSYVPPEFARADPFWAPGNTATAVGTSGKTEKKVIKK
jgi:hypothetical protein